MLCRKLVYVQWWEKWVRDSQLRMVSQYYRLVMILYPSVTLLAILGWSFITQVYNFVIMSFAEIMKLSTGRNSFTIEATETLINSFVPTWLDYCNSLYCGFPEYQIGKLQHVPNTAARLITGSWKYKHITPVLWELQWLPVHHRTQYKIILGTYKCLNSVFQDTCCYCKMLLNVICC